MFSPAKLSLKISRENMYKAVLRWESNTRMCIAIVSKQTVGLLTYIKVPEHSIPVGWRVRIGGDYYLVVASYRDVIVIENIANTSGDILEYNTPTDLTRYTFKVHVYSIPAGSIHVYCTDNTIVLEAVHPVIPGQYAYTIEAYDDSTEILVLAEGIITCEE